MKLILISHGLKKFTDMTGSGPSFSIPKADLYVDARVLMDLPTNEIISDRITDVRLRHTMEDYQPATLDRIEKIIREGLGLIPIRRRNSDPNHFNDPVIICFFCAWGLNRSPTCKVIMGERLKQDYDVVVI